MPGKLAVSVMLGVGLGVAGCGREYNTAPSPTQAKVAEMCGAVSQLSTSLAPVSAISPSTTTAELQQLRGEIELEGIKVVDKQGQLNETVRNSLARARTDFLASVDHFGGTATVGSAAAEINPHYQAFKSNVDLAKSTGSCKSTG